MTLDQLTRVQCEAMLSDNSTASLACVRGGVPYVVPITYAFSGGVIYSFSREGQKLDWMRANPLVSLLVVDHGAGSTWKSVVVSGSFEEFTKAPNFDRDNDLAWKALSKRAEWWNPGSLTLVGRPRAETVSYIYYRVRIYEMTGRATHGTPHRPS